VKLYGTTGRKPIFELINDDDDVHIWLRLIRRLYINVRYWLRHPLHKDRIACFHLGSQSTNPCFVCHTHRAL